MSRSTFIKTLVIIFVIFLIVLDLSKTWRLPSSSEVIAFSPNGEMLATASGKIVSKRITPNNTMGDFRSDSSQVEIRKVATGKTIQTLDFFSASSLAFSPDNNLIAAGDYGGEIKIWRISDGQLVHSFKRAERYSDKTTFLSFTPDGQTLVAATERYFNISDEPSQLNVWNLNSGNNHYTLSKPFTCAAASPDGQLLALGGQIEPLTLYRLKDGIPIRPIVTEPIICSNLQFSADSKLLVFVSHLSQ
jgi:WD40 repeat protein